MFDDLIELVFPGAGWLAIGVAIGTAFSDQLRPVAKEAIKLGMAVGERVAEVSTEAFESAQDMVAEARHERVNNSRPRSSAPRRPARRGPSS